MDLMTSFQAIPGFEQSGALYENGILRGMVQTAENAARYLPEPVASGVEFAASLSRVGSSTTVDISPAYQDLINKQIETQAELQQVTFISNIERSQHEIRMAAVRNLRAA